MLLLTHLEVVVRLRGWSEWMRSFDLEVAFALEEVTLGLLIGLSEPGCSGCP